MKYGKLWLRTNSAAFIKNNFQKYIGTYKDNWFGAVTLYEKKGKMYFASTRSKRLVGEVFFYKDQNFVSEMEHPKFSCRCPFIF